MFSWAAWDWRPHDASNICRPLLSWSKVLGRQSWERKFDRSSDHRVDTGIVSFVNSASMVNQTHPREMIVKQSNVCCTNPCFVFLYYGHGQELPFPLNNLGDCLFLILWFIFVRFWQSCSLSANTIENARTLWNQRVPNTWLHSSSPWLINEIVLWQYNAWIVSDTYITFEYNSRPTSRSTKDFARPHLKYNHSGKIFT